MPTALPRTTVASPDGTTPTTLPPRDAMIGETALEGTAADEQAAMATQLTALVECVDDPRPRAVAHLRWRPARQAEAQRVEVTVRRDGFATGDYDAGPLLDADSAEVDWTQLHGQAVHLWRVVTLTGEASTPSDTAVFEGPDCAADYVSKPTARW